MKVIETIYKRKEYSDDEPSDYRVKVKLIPDEALCKAQIHEVSFGHGEPEDMFLYRNLNDAYSIIELVKLAHFIGASGEALVIERIEEVEEY